MSLHSGFTLVDGDDIIPETTDTSNLGSSSKQFAAIYAVDGYFETAEGEKVEVNNAAGTWRSVEYQTGGSMRWVITADSASESGGNAGSDFQLRRYDDSGSYIDNPIHIYRSDGVVRMVNGAKVDTIEEYTSGAGITLADAVEVNKTVSYAYQYLHQAPFSGWSTNAPSSGSATAAAGRLQITIDDGALTDSGEVWLSIYDADGAGYVHLDDKAMRFRVRGYLKLSDLGSAHSEVNLARIVVTGANVWLGFKFTIEVGGSPVTQTVRLYAVNEYWDSGTSSYVETASLIHTWTHQSVGVAHEINFELDVASDASNATCKELITDDSATISVGDDNNQASAELDVWLWRNTANCGYDIELDIMQWTFAREW